MNIAILVLLVLIILQNLLRTAPKSDSSDPFLAAKIDAILEKLEVEFDPTKNLPRQIFEAARKGKKIEAIKLYRQATGVGLKESKEFIDNYLRTQK